MKKLLLSTLFVFCASLSRADTNTNRFGLVQISTSPGDIWGTKTNANWATVDAGVAGLGLYNLYTTTNVFSAATYFTTMSAGSCFTVDATGLLIGQACGGGGGASSLAIFNGTSGSPGVAISSPTSGENDNNADFTDTLQGGATVYRSLNSATTKFIHNSASAQTAAMNISTATVGNVTISTLTVLSSATISNVNLTGTTLAYSSGTFLNSVAIGTTNANGQSLRVIDTGSGINTYESANNQTMYYELENNTSGTLANEYMELIGTGGDSATGAKAGDGEVKALNALYLIAGGASSKKGIAISTNGVTNEYFSDGSTQTTAFVGGGNYIQNTSSLQSGATFYVSSGTVNQQLEVGGGNSAAMIMNPTTWQWWTAPIPTPTNFMSMIGSNQNGVGSNAGIEFYYPFSNQLQATIESGATPNLVIYSTGTLSLCDWQPATVGSNRCMLFKPASGMSASYTITTPLAQGTTNTFLQVSGDANTVEQLTHYDLFDSSPTWTGQANFSSADPSTFTVLAVGSLSVTSAGNQTAPSLAFGGYATGIYGNASSYLTFVTSGTIDLLMTNQIGGPPSVQVQQPLYVTAPATSIYALVVSTAIGSINGKPYFIDVSTTGHLNAQTVSGSTVTSCGNNPILIGSDISGTISTSGSVTGCTLTFAKPFINTPVCTESDTSTTITADISSISNTSVTFGFSSSLGSGKIYYICIGSD